jgi:hypothetical protein
MSRRLWFTCARRLALLVVLLASGCGGEGEADDFEEPAPEWAVSETIDDAWSRVGSDEQSAPGATCDANAVAGLYCAGDKVTGGVVGTLYRCDGPNVPARVVEVCTQGCEVRPGSNDGCSVSAPEPTPSGAPTPGAYQPPACAKHPTLLKSGLHPRASDLMRCAGLTAARISQTIGYAAASAGTHAPDGTVNGVAYSAATDLSVRGMTDAQVKVLVAQLDGYGFAAFFRNPGQDGWPASQARHIHAVYAGAKMKASLRAQISDFLVGKNGLASHTAYTFYQPPAAVKAYVKSLFNAAN